MTPRRIHREKMLRDDILWLETRIRELQAASEAGERRRAECYCRLLQQRRIQLESGTGADGLCAGCWPEYFSRQGAGAGLA